MSGHLELRYRRVLGPAGFRRDWEEDMVGAFMEGAHASDPNSDGATARPSLAERLSVVALALRLRLNGSHASPRGLVWYRAAHGLALLVLLYQAIAATIAVALGIQVAARSSPSPILDFFVWSRGFSLSWVAAFSSFVLGRVVLARVFVLLAAAATLGVTAATYAIVGSPSAAGVPFGPADVSRWGWLAVSVAVVFVGPPTRRTSPRFWFAAYLMGSVVLVPIALQAFTPYAPLVRLANLTNTTSAALIVAMAVALLRLASSRRASIRWLLALAVFAVGFGGIRLTTSLAAEPLPTGATPYSSLPLTLDAILVTLATLCGIVGLLALQSFSDVQDSRGYTPASDHNA